MNKKRWALITGSSKGLGKTLAFEFAAAGYNIIISGRNGRALARVRKAIIRKGVKCLSISGDLNSLRTIRKLEKVSLKEGISVLVNNAGLLCPHKPLERLKEAQVLEILKTNLLATLLLTRKIYTYFIKKKSGVIININSLSGLKCQKFRSVYCASKWGLRGFSGTLRLEAKQKGVRIIDVFPGKINKHDSVKRGLNTAIVSKKIILALGHPKIESLKLK